MKKDVICIKTITRCVCLLVILNAFSNTIVFGSGLFDLKSIDGLTALYLGNGSRLEHAYSEVRWVSESIYIGHDVDEDAWFEIKPRSRTKIVSGGEWTITPFAARYYQCYNWDADKTIYYDSFLSAEVGHFQDVDQLTFVDGLLFGYSEVANGKFHVGIFGNKQALDIRSEYPIVYEDAFAIYRTDLGYGIIDLYGKYVMQPRALPILRSGLQGTCFIVEEVSSTPTITLHNYLLSEKASELEFESVSSFFHSRCRVRLKGEDLYSFIDEFGRLAGYGKFEKVTDFNNQGVSFYIREGNFGLLKVSGDRIALEKEAMGFTAINPFFAEVKLEGKSRIYASDGALVLERGEAKGGAETRGGP